ncbi:DUF2793 domain-containing protein [Devosia chinhatensis]|uniref:DUF2793 domain-containing protein n=1 Tax=Devosia chinhatensis TaxID=429727 RepID=UPI0006969AE8|nr:DUF2793 domain-containing protein [Devosia chinhatensis]
MDHTARLDLPFIMAGQALKHITHNEALETLDALVQPIVETRGLASPPASPLPGEAWIVPAGATGAWSGHADQIAAFQSGAWRFYDPAEGWQVFDRASDTLLVYSGSAWLPLAALGAGLPLFGVNTSADATNRLAVSAAATLFTHDGAGHQLKLNKAASGHTASLLFQSNWTGRAEMGLMGDDLWRLKVSPNGTSWVDAIAVNATTGAASFAAAPRPALDNAMTLGASGARWSAIWSATGTIQTSDARLKTAVAPTDLGLDFILALRPVRFAWIGGDDQTHYGLIAQEVAACLAGRSFGGHVVEDDRHALRYDQFIAPLIRAVQELSARIAAVEAA